MIEVFTHEKTAISCRCWCLDLFWNRVLRGVAPKIVPRKSITGDFMMCFVSCPLDQFFGFKSLVWTNIVGLCFTEKGSEFISARTLLARSVLVSKTLRIFSYVSLYHLIMEIIFFSSYVALILFVIMNWASFMWTCLCCERIMWTSCWRLILAFNFETIEAFGNGNK